MKKGITIWSLVFVLLAAAAFAQMSSTSYNMTSIVVTNGGGNMSSPSYKMDMAVGGIVGNASSASYTASLGVYYTFAVEMMLDYNFTFYNNDTLTAYGFKSGTLTNLSYDNVTMGLVLDNGKTSGSYVSEVFDSSNRSEWQAISFNGNIYDNYTKLMLHFEGADESINDNDFIDSSNQFHIVTQEGNAKLENSTSKFGATAIQIQGDGDSINITDSPDWDLGSDNFTIDFWFKNNGTATDYKGVISRDFTTSTKPYMIVYRSGALQFFASSNSASWDISNAYTFGSVSSSAFIHYALVRNGTTFTTYRNGIQQIQWNSGGIIDSSTSNLYIGAQHSTAGLNAFIDEVRISKGIARWTSNFVPPTRSYASMVNLSVRSCNLTDCSEDTWVDINDTNQTLSLDMDRYFQYKLEYDTLNATTNLFMNNITVEYMILPELYFVEVNLTPLSANILDNLTCFVNVTRDATVNFTWYVNNTNNDTFDTSISCNAYEPCISPLVFTNLSYNTTYFCSAVANDTWATTSVMNSSVVNITDAAPWVVLDWPANNETITNRTPNLLWNATDPDGDSLTFEINFTCSPTCSDENFTNSGFATENYTIDMINYLDGYSYNWSVRAYDGKYYSEWVWFNFTVDSLVSVRLDPNALQFGTLTPGENNNTVNDDPAPLGLLNIGNVYSNVTINFTTWLWSSQATTSDYYQYKIGMAGAEYAFNSTESAIIWKNVSVGENSVDIVDLNWYTNNRTAEIDFNVTAPMGEPVGDKSSNFTITAEATKW